MYQISSEAYLDRFNECYKNIVVISPKPNDASLNSITRPITREKLSPFQEISPCCPLDRCIYMHLYIPIIDANCYASMIFLFCLDF